MTEPDEKTKTIVPTRTPKKKTQGIFDNLRTLPQPHPVEEILGLSPTTDSIPSRGSTDSSSSTPSIPRRGSTPSSPSRRTSPRQSVSPERDFTKVANSIVRSAVPSGIFGEQGGKSKELYDTLYSVTRGAIVPTRRIRIPKDQLMRKAGIGSEVTLRKNLARLRDAGLIKESIVPGTHGGNEYEVFLPEEIGLTGSTPSTPSSSSSSRQMQETLPPLTSTASSASSTQEQTTASSEAKTSFKTNTEKTDDEAAPLVTAALKKLIEELTGREATRVEFDKLVELVEVLITEGKIAAARTTVSSAGPFLAEHLRRRLFKKDKQELDRETRSEAAGLTAPAIDSSACPDCGGAGWYYPDGPEKGVAKCRHESLRQADDTNPSAAASE